MAKVNIGSGISFISSSSVSSASTSPLGEVLHRPIETTTVKFLSLEEFLMADWE